MLRASDRIAITSAEERPSAVHISSIPPNFRQGYGEHAAAIAQEIKRVSTSSCEKILEMAASVQEAKNRLSRKEFSSFVRDLLEWLGSDARKYLNIARVFEGFELSRLSALEPFTLLKLCGKRYQPVVDALRKEVGATGVRVQELIKELLPKQPRKKKPSADYGDAVLQRHPNMEDGTFYFTLKNANISDSVGLWLEKKLKNQTIGQVLQAAAEAELAAPVQPSEYTRAQMAEFRESVNEMRELAIVKQKLEMQLSDREQRIAELEAELARKSSDQIAIYNADDRELEMYESFAEDIEAEISGAQEDVPVADVATGFNVGDVVSHADPYVVAHSYRGKVEEIIGADVLVRWSERRGKANEQETYRASDLKHSAPVSLQIGMCVILKKSPAKFCMPGDFWEVAGIRGDKIKVSLNGRGELIDSTVSNVDKILP